MMRDQWYEPNLLYNIHWRPPVLCETTMTTPKMIVLTTESKPSLCTCGHHHDQLQYRINKRVIWSGQNNAKHIRNQVTRTASKVPYSRTETGRMEDNRDDVIPDYDYSVDLEEKGEQLVKDGEQEEQFEDDDGDLREDGNESAYVNSKDKQNVGEYVGRDLNGSDISNSESCSDFEDGECIDLDDIDICGSESGSNLGDSDTSDGENKDSDIAAISKNEKCAFRNTRCEIEGNSCLLCEKLNGYKKLNPPGEDTDASEKSTGSDQDTDNENNAEDIDNNVRLISEMNTDDIARVMNIVCSGKMPLGRALQLGKKHSVARNAVDVEDGVDQIRKLWSIEDDLGKTFDASEEVGSAFGILSVFCQNEMNT